MRRTLAALILIMVYQPTAVRAQYTPTLTINPTSGPSGTMISIQGTRYGLRIGLTLFRIAWHGGTCVVPSEYPESIPVATDRQGHFTYIDKPERTSNEQVGVAYGIPYPDFNHMITACFRFTDISSRYFPETGHTLSSRFFAFWQANGGLPVYGYPITDAKPEVNPDTGQTYLTQWFERNRLEYHPENQPPYDILLGRLGSDRLKQIGRDWQAEGQEPGPKQGCLWFEQTGHNVCDQSPSLVCYGGMADYWSCFGLRLNPGQINDTGSLALFGYPLTTARMETNSSGDTVLTQWFERARFEWHDNPDVQGEILLGLLGNEVHH